MTEINIEDWVEIKPNGEYHIHLPHNLEGVDFDELAEKLKEHLKSINAGEVIFYNRNKEK